jgi:kanamycin kinase
VIFSAIPGTPPPEVVVPPALLDLAAGEPVRPVWLNEVGGLTVEVGAGERRRFVKWAPAGCGLDLDAERSRLGWAARFTPVPRVLAQGADDAGAWLVTAALPGQSAVSPSWLAEPARAVRGIGLGLRALHDRLPVEACPFSWSMSDRIARKRAMSTDPVVLQRLDRLGAPPTIDRLVVCQGDACAPNTLLGDDGELSGHVDLGDLGVADRWADLAVATWSTHWNYGPGWDDVLLEAYGIDPDPERTRYYRVLWSAED